MLPLISFDLVILFVRMWVEIVKGRTEERNEVVILFVRMWVEISSMLLNTRSQLSSSSWGCELKWIWNTIFWLRNGSSSSWGCELKYHEHCQGSCWTNVILFVRMWVEINIALQRGREAASSSSWGCELKYKIFRITMTHQSHPLREDVSWNIFNYSQQGVKALSSSSWGCELKCHSNNCWIWRYLSSSSWGCELKYTSSPCKYASSVVILFVRMWVEILIPSTFFQFCFVILFVRMWVEMPFFRFF